jgi:hypothetical protein
MHNRMAIGNWDRGWGYMEFRLRVHSFGYIYTSSCIYWRHTLDIKSDLDDYKRNHFQTYSSFSNLNKTNFC